MARLRIKDRFYADAAAVRRSAELYRAALQKELKEIDAEIMRLMEARITELERENQKLRERP